MTCAHSIGLQFCNGWSFTTCCYVCIPAVICGTLKFTHLLHLIKKSNGFNSCIQYTLWFISTKWRVLYIPLAFLEKDSNDVCALKLISTLESLAQPLHKGLEGEIWEYYVRQEGGGEQGEEWRAGGGKRKGQNKFGFLSGSQHHTKYLFCTPLLWDGLKIFEHAYIL